MKNKNSNPRICSFSILAVALLMPSLPAFGGDIAIKGYAFSPKASTISPGETVIWRNEDRTRHNVVIDGQKSPTLQQGDSFKFVVGKAGEYPYHCSLHPGMKGVLVVAYNSAAAAPAAAIKSKPTPNPAVVAGAKSEASTGGDKIVQIVDFMRFEPAEIAVAPGQSVIWINRDGSNHKIQFADSVSKRMRHDASYSKRFDKPGRYDYICAIHGDKMSGTVVVKAAN